jgi:hypothetical protein
MELNRMLQLAGLVSESHDKVAELPASVTMLPEKTTLTENDKSSDYARWLQLAGLVSENQLDEHYWVNVDLLLEGKKEENIAANNGPALVAAWKQDNGQPADADPQHIIDYVSQHTSPANIVWIAQRFIGNKKAPRDLHISNFPELQRALAWFNTSAAKEMLASEEIPSDIGQYSTYKEFKEKVEPHVGKKSINQMDKEQEGNVRAAGKLALEATDRANAGITDIVGNPNTNKVFHAFTVDNKFAAMYFGGKLLDKYYTKAAAAWCTGVMGHNEKGQEKTQFDTYHGEGKGKIYIIFTTINGEPRRFQLHMEKDQFMHEGNNAVNKEDIAELSKIPQYTEFLNFLIKKYYHVPESK